MTVSAWQSFLQEHDATSSAAAAAAQAACSDWLAPLSHLAMLEASGDDAASFLHNQITNDVEGLGASEARLAAYCSAKGRMLASLLIWRTPEAVMLQLPSEILPPIRKRLQMYVLRSKVKLEPSALVALGCGGEKACASLLAHLGASLPATPFARATVGESTLIESTLIRFPDAQGQPRLQWVGPADAALEIIAALRPSLPLAHAARWRLSEIHAGLPSIVAATQEAFVPQMINFELIGGVNFRKGCYPGQEIVARSQYLGKLKRRTFIASVASDAVAAGAEIYADSDPAQPAGAVVNAEIDGPGTSACLIELKTADGGAMLHLGSPDGAVLSLGELPYPLTEPS